MIALEKQFELIDRYGVWADDTNASVIIEKAKIVVADILKNQYSKQNKIYRLAGQSGSGKSTQLMPAVLEILEQQNKNPIIIGVRTFSTYHPNYEQIVKAYPKGEIRERTNGFALKCLCATFSILIGMGYLIVLDLTIMDKWFEEFILQQIKQNNYKVQYHILAVNIQISNGFIEKRRNDPNSAEFGKMVNNASIQLWYKELNYGVKYLSINDKENNCFIWSAFNKEPLYFGLISNCLNALESGQSQTGSLTHSEAELLKAKIDFILKLAK